MRWPAGPFADDYHWKDGVGPPAERPTRVNPAWQQTEPNRFGTDEFIRACHAIGCEPSLTVNVVTGSAREARDWLEYTNFGGESDLSALRSANGSPAPYEVKYWKVGNNCVRNGAARLVDAYAAEYARYAQCMKQLCPAIELTACGSSPDYNRPDLTHWNRDFCTQMVDETLIDHLAVQRTFARGTATGFSDQEYRDLFGDLLALEHDLDQTGRILAYCYPGKCVGIAVDQWGLHHPEAEIDNGMEQPGALRDAVFAGAALNLLTRNAHRVSMANASQAINVLQCLARTDGARMVLTPTYYVFDMMRPHMNARLLTHQLDCETDPVMPMGLPDERSLPKLSVNVSQNGKKAFISVANQTIDEPIETNIEVRDATIAAATGRCLTSVDARQTNSFDYPRRVVPKRLKLTPQPTSLTHVFPPHSFTAISLTLG